MIGSITLHIDDDLMLREQLFLYIYDDDVTLEEEMIRRL